MPRFDFPDFTAPTAQVAPEIPPQQPLPSIIDLDGPLVTNPAGEPLVRVAHRRIRVLSNYWHSGWQHARPDCWARQSVMERLAAVADGLPEGFGLAVFDAWRPLDLQVELYEAAYGDGTLPPGFVALPSQDPASPPPHLTGGTVDLTVTFDGTPIAAGTGYDDFTARARVDALEAEPGPDREARRLLFWAMAARGFVVVESEWWHFEYGTSRWAGITGSEPLYGAAYPDD